MCDFPELGTIDCPCVALARATFATGKKLLPPLVLMLLHHLICTLVGFVATEYRDGFSMIAAKECGVDFHAVYNTGCGAEADGYPVVRFGVMPAGFPTVVPGAWGFFSERWEGLVGGGGHLILRSNLGVGLAREGL